MNDSYGFAISDFLAEKFSETKDYVKSCPYFAALLSSGPLFGVL